MRERPEAGAGQALLRALLVDADVLVENFKPGTLDKWGPGRAAIERAFPRLVAWPHQRLWRRRPAGRAARLRCVRAGDVRPDERQRRSRRRATRVGLPIVDMVTGLNAAVGILAALAECERSGWGQFVDVTLFDSAIGLLHPHAANFFLSRKVPGRTGNAHPNIAPYETFATRTGPIFLAVGNNRQFGLLAGQLGAPRLAADARFATNGDRVVNRDALRATLAVLLASHDAAELAMRLLRAGVPPAPVLDVGQVLSHEHALHRSMVVELDGCQGIGPPIKLSRTPASVRRAPPAFAQHTGAVLQERGLDAERFEAALVPARAE